MAVSRERTVALSSAALPPTASLRWPPKSPNDVADYSLDISAYLDDAEDEIASFAVTVRPGGVAGDLEVAGTATSIGAVMTARLTGGRSQILYAVRFDVITAGDRHLSLDVWLLVRQLSSYVAPGNVYPPVIVGPSGERGPRGDSGPPLDLADTLNDLPELATLRAGDKMPIVRGGETLAIDGSDVLAAAGEAGGDAAIAALGLGARIVQLAAPTALTAAAHGGRTLILTNGAHQISVAWDDTGHGFACELVNWTSYYCVPSLSGFDRATPRGDGTAIRPDGAAVLRCIELDDGSRYAQLSGGVE